VNFSDAIQPETTIWPFISSALNSYQLLLFCDGPGPANQSVLIGDGPTPLAGECQPVLRVKSFNTTFPLGIARTFAFLLEISEKLGSDLPRPSFQTWDL
jgi:hypothetical protein